LACTSNSEKALRTRLFGGVFVALCGCAWATAGTDTPASTSASADGTDIRIVRQDVSSTLPAGQALVIDNPYGDVRLRFGGYENVLELHAVAQQPAAARAIVLQPAVDGGRYRIAPRLPQGTLVAPGQRLDMVILVPLGHSVSVHTERGLIESHGVRADIDLRSTAGDIAVRGTQGGVNAETGPGSIEASLGKAPAGSRQRLATSTGNIVLAVDDGLDAHLDMATSAAFATEYSLQITHLPAQEPNKRAHALIGDDRASIVVESRRGEIRLLRRSGFMSTDPESGQKEETEEEADSDSD
jgi:hypothetical protein